MKTPTMDDVRLQVDASRQILHDGIVLTDIACILRAQVSNDPELSESYALTVARVGDAKIRAALDLLHRLHASLNADDEAAADAAASTAPSDPTVN